MPPLISSHDEVKMLLESRPIVVLDLETNGFDVSTDILEIGAVRYEPGTLTREQLVPSVTWQQLIYFDGVPNMGAFEVNKLNPIQLKTEGIALGKALAQLKDLTHDAVIVGQNVFAFDLPIINYHCAQHGIELSHTSVVDTLLLAKSQIRLPRYRLEDLARHFSFKNIPSHRALDDVLATAELLAHLVYPKGQASLL